ncbi:MAG: DUF748 domain-containing protein [Thermodesulfobacteriota bacterium]|nr:DUF748 domain-containing protein [Thermodesulfobacteriota bacterium]
MDEKEQGCPFGSIQVADEKRETSTLFPEVPELKPKQPITNKCGKAGDLLNVWKLLPLIALVGAALYVLAGFFAVPFLVRTVLPERFEEHIGRPVTVGSVAFNPFTLQLTLSNAIIGARLSDPDDEIDPILSFSKLRMNIEAVSILKHGLVCRKFEIDNPFVHVEKDGDNLYNISDVFPPAPKPKEQEENYKTKGLSEIIGIPFSFHLKNVIVNNGHIRFDDRPANQSHNAEEINLVFPLLTNFSSAAGSIEALIQSVSLTPPRFSAKIDGSLVNLIAETEVIDQAVKTTFKISFKALDLVALSHYFPNRLDQPAIAGGKADLDLDLIFTLKNKGTDAGLEIKGGAQFSDVLLNTRKGRPLIKLAAGNVAGIFSPTNREYHCTEIVLEGPEIRIERSVDAGWILPWTFDLKKGPDSRSGSEEPLKVRIDSLRVSKGKLLFSDKFIPGGYSDTWSEISMSLNSFSPGNDKPAEFTINGKNQAKATFAGQGQVHAMPFKAEGFVVMEGVDIARLKPYFHPASELRVRGGQASRMEARFMFGKDQDPEKLNLILTDAALQFRDLTLAESDTKYLHLPDLTFSNAGFDMNRKILDLGLVRAEKGNLLFKWDKKGELNWKRYFVYKGQEKNGEKKKSWVVRAHSLDFSNGLVDIDSNSEIDPLNLRLKDVLFNAKDLSTESGSKGTISGSAGLDSASLRFSGNLTLSPFSATVGWSGNELPAASLSPLVSGWFAPGITDGVITAEGTVHIPDFSYSGNVGISNFSAQDRKGRQVVKWRQALCRNLNFRSNPPLVEISSILADGPVVKLFSQGDGPLSAGFFKGSRSKKDGNKSRNKLKIGSITVNNGDFVYSDTTLGSPYSLTLSDLSGSISGIINSHGNRAAYSLKGRVPSPKGAQSASSFSAKGETGLFDERLFAGLTVKIVNMDIRPLSPWFSHNLGYMVRGGVFDLTSIFRQENLEMSGSNQIRVTCLELGKRIDEKSQLEFAIGLLSGQDNIINLDLSVTGPAGPSFSYGHGLAGGLRGLLLKTRIFPFLLLPLSPNRQVPPDHLIIPYGRSELTQDNMAQLKEMARILEMRPLIELKIRGFAEPNGDGEFLLNELKKEAARRRIEEESRFFHEMSMDYKGEEIRFPRPEGVENERSMPASVAVSDDLLLILAKQRANAVRDFLVNDLDVAPDRIHVDKAGGLIRAESLGRPGNRVDFILMSSKKALKGY